jgi:hypothetical protein
MGHDFSNSIKEGLRIGAEMSYLSDDTELIKEIATAINRNSRENASGTPDFILAEYLVQCLHAYEKATRSKEDWYTT